MKYRLLIILAFLVLCPTFSLANDVSQQTAEVLKQADNLFDGGGNRDQAFSILMDAYRKADDEGNRLDCARILQKYASFLWLDNGSSSGVGVFLCALSYCPEDDKKLRVLITQGIGQSYCELGKYSLSEKYLKESLSLAREIGYKYGEIMALHNLAVMYQYNKDYSHAIAVNKDGIGLARQQGNKYMEGTFFINLGNVESDYNDKINHIKQGIQIEDSVGAKNVIFYAWYNIAEAQLEAARYDEAIQSAKNALSYSDFVDESDQILHSTYSLLADIYAAQKDFSSSYYYTELYRKVRDKSDDQLKNRSGEFIEDIREIEKRTNDFLKYSYWSEINWWNVIAVGSLLILILIAVVVFARFRVYKLYRASTQRIKETEQKYEHIQAEFTAYQTKAEQTNEEYNKTISELTEQNRMLAVFKDSRNILLKKISEMIKSASDTLPIADQVKLKNIIHFIKNSIITPSAKDSQTIIHNQDSGNDAKDFKTRLKERFPNLSTNEEQLCEYFQMGLNTREISQLSGKPIKTVNMARYRLRKSLELSPEDDLTQFLKNI